VRPVPSPSFVSALLLQRQLGISRCETAWMMLHKLRRAMVNVTREPLRGEVEVDETWVGGEQARLRGSRQLKNRRAALVLVAVEKRGRATGRARMNVIPAAMAQWHPSRRQYEQIRGARDLNHNKLWSAEATGKSEGNSLTWRIYPNAFPLVTLARTILSTASSTSSMLKAVESR
jgi:hypothetical protein